MEYSSVNAVGVWFYSTTTDRYLYLLRNDKKYHHTWGLPGGKIEGSETLLEAITRECNEELGYMPEYTKLVPVAQFTSPNSTFTYHTFFCCLTDEFIPVLNSEHIGYAWVNSGSNPKPLHPGLWNTINFDLVKTKINSIKQIVNRAITPCT